jgi:hypothetical protein
MHVCRRYTTFSSLRQGRCAQSSIGCVAIASVASRYWFLFLPRDRACVCIARALPRALASQAILPATGIRPGRLLSVSTTAESTAAGSPVPTLPYGAAGRSALSAGCLWVHGWAQKNSSTPTVHVRLDQAHDLA